MASEYHWGRHEIWHEISMNEILLYLRAISIRKIYEAGNEANLPTDGSILDLLDIIETVTNEKNVLKSKNTNKVVKDDKDKE